MATIAATSYASHKVAGRSWLPMLRSRGNLSNGPQRVRAREGHHMELQRDKKPNKESKKPKQPKAPKKPKTPKPSSSS